MRNRSKSLYIPRKPQIAEDDEETSTESEPFSANEKHTTNSWSNDDERQLVEKVKNVLPKIDKHRIHIQLKKLNWSEVQFGDHSANDCENHFQILLKSIRKYRVLSEIIDDVEASLLKHPIKRPPTSYNLFLKDMYNRKPGMDLQSVAKLYKELSPKDKAKYDATALNLKTEYLKKIQEFYKDNPKTAELVKARAQKQKPVTPFNLFFDYKKLFGDVKRTELVNEYHNLSLDEKYKWIEKAITTNPDVEHKQFLTKDEVRIMTGNFKKSPSAYGLFLRDNFDKNASNAMRDVARKWKTLDPTHKSEYIRRSEDLKQSHASKVQSFVTRHDIPVQKTKKRKNNQKTESTDDDDKHVPAVSLKGIVKSKKKENNLRQKKITDILEKQPNYSSKKSKALEEPSTPSPLKSPLKSPKKSRATTEPNNFDGNLSQNQEYTRPIKNGPKHNKAALDDFLSPFRPSVNSTKHKLSQDDVDHQAGSANVNRTLNNGEPSSKKLKRKRFYDDIDSDQTEKLNNTGNGKEANDIVEKLKYNHYTYVSKKAINETKTKWACSRKESKQCDAKIFTQRVDGEYQVVKEKGEHNHPAKRKKNDSA